jgi:hypothetical protein
MIGASADSCGGVTVFRCTMSVEIEIDMLW